ncbi:unnamed protein product [Caenorhabditis angaria]|uniref:Uncharacterized protein n=1 Tax=Caenorhabditis angaria TaxID=860376 RepID=A0A9P1IDT6_9PELO|nr:unnamed protein product [Caenorhabditis angaria]
MGYGGEFGEEEAGSWEKWERIQMVLWREKEESRSNCGFCLSFWVDIEFDNLETSALGISDVEKGRRIRRISFIG